MPQNPQASQIIARFKGARELHAYSNARVAQMDEIPMGGLV